MPMPWPVNATSTALIVQARQGARDLICHRYATNDNARTEVRAFSWWS
jgi:hypothetical protein